MVAIALANPDFETGSNPVNTFTYSSGSTSYASGIAARSGSGYGLWRPTTATTPQWVEVLVNGGYIASSEGEHTFAAWLNKDATMSGVNVTMRIEAYNASNALLSTKTVTTEMAQASLSYTQYSATQTLVTGTTKVKCVIRVDVANNSNNAWIFIDDITLDRGAASVPTPSPFTLWNGTAEVPLTLEGVYNGTSVVPVVSTGVAP